MRRIALLTALLLLPPIALTGCVSSGSCVDFVGLPTAQDRYDAAPVVLVATVTRTERTTSQNAVYPVYRARVERVLKGRMDRGAVDVYAPSDQCVTSGQPAEYLDGDPLDGVDRAVLYLGAHAQGGVYQLITPGALDRLPAGADLPFTATPTPSPSAG